MARKREYGKAFGLLRRLVCTYKLNILFTYIHRYAL